MREIQELALEATRLARQVIMAYYSTELKVEFKADHSPVTIADQKAEEVMREFLAKEMPGCGLLGEEHGYENAGAEWIWIMDPIDGTKSFIHHAPLFGTLLACYHNFEPELGLIDMSALGPNGSTLWAQKGHGLWLDGQPSQVSKVADLGQACVLSGTVTTFETENMDLPFRALRHQSRLYRGWGDAFGYYQVATGRAEVMVDPIVSLWDVAAMPVIFAEGGGRFSDLQGQLNLVESLRSGQISYQSDDRTGLATNGLLHDRVLNLFHP